MPPAPLGICVIPEGIHGTYKIDGNLNYYVFVKENASITLVPADGKQEYQINFNIWGDGNINIKDSICKMNAVFNYPGEAALKGLKIWTYKQNFVEVLNG